jgi:hypothetical protein
MAQLQIMQIQHRFSTTLSTMQAFLQLGSFLADNLRHTSVLI